MKGSRSLFASLLLMSLAFAACGETPAGSETGSMEESAASEDLAENTSASAEEVAKNFLDALTEDGWEAAKAYVAPEYREDSELTSSWNNPEFQVESYSDVDAATTPYMGKTSVTFTTSGKWGGTDYSATGGVSTAEIDGVWWIVPSTYTPAE